MHILLDLIILLQEPAKSVFCVSGWECVLWRPGAGRRGRPHKSLRLPGEPGSVAGVASPEPEPGELGGGGMMMCVMDMCNIIGWEKEFTWNRNFEIHNHPMNHSMNHYATIPNHNTRIAFIYLFKLIVIPGLMYVRFVWLWDAFQHILHKSKN